MCRRRGESKQTWQLYYNLQGNNNYLVHGENWKINYYISDSQFNQKNKDEKAQNIKIWLVAREFFFTVELLLPSKLM